MPSRHFSRLPQTDHHKLYKEIIEGPRFAALPQKLSDKWLRLIARDIAYIRMQYRSNHLSAHPEDIAGFPAYMAGPTMLLEKLLKEYKGRMLTEKELISYDINKCIDNYWMGITQEIIMREIGVKYTKLTHENLFFATRQIW